MESKICRDCAVLKSLDCFYRNRGNYYPECKDCRNTASRNKRKINSALYKERDAARRQKDGDILKRRLKVWKKLNKARVMADVRRRQARKLNATPEWAESEFEKFAIQEVYDLAVRRTATTGLKWQVDHIVPLQSDVVCGLHCLVNLAVVLAIDNQVKGNRFWPDMPEGDD